MEHENGYYAAKAEANFRSGYNCAQSVFLAFEDLYTIDHDTAMRMSSSFGGGMGRLREVCGAVSAIFMVAGLLYGYADVNDPDQKPAHYARIQALAKAFEAKHGTIICRELLRLDRKVDIPIPEARTEHYYASRPCPGICADAADILENYIRENPIPNK